MYELDHEDDVYEVVDNTLVEAQMALGRRQHVYKELVKTERDYIADLKIVINAYYDAMDPDNMSIPLRLRGKRDIVFGNLLDIYNFHQKVFIEALEDCSEQTERVGKCFVQYVSEFEMYSLYCKNRPKSEILVNETTESQAFFKGIQRNLAHALDLNSYLLKPVQRITKYQLLLKDLLACSPEVTLVDLEVAHSTVRKILQDLNDSMHTAGLTGLPDELPEQGKLLVHDAFQVSVLESKGLSPFSRSRERHVFLFEKVVIISKKTETHDEKKGKKTDAYVYKEHLDMSNVSLRANLEARPPQFSLSDQGKQKVYKFEDRSREIPAMWVTEIRRLLQIQFADLKRRLQTTDKGQCLDCAPRRAVTPEPPSGSHFDGQLELPELRENRVLSDSEAMPGVQRSRDLRPRSSPDLGIGQRRAKTAAATKNKKQAGKSLKFKYIFGATKHKSLPYNVASLEILPPTPGVTDDFPDDMYEVVEDTLPVGQNTPESPLLTSEDPSNDVYELVEAEIPFVSTVEQNLPEVPLYLDVLSSNSPSDSEKPVEHKAPQVMKCEKHSKLVNQIQSIGLDDQDEMYEVLDTERPSTLIATPPAVMSGEATSEDYEVVDSDKPHLLVKQNSLDEPTGPDDTYEAVDIEDVSAVVGPAIVSYDSLDEKYENMEAKKPTEEILVKNAESTDLQGDIYEVPDPNELSVASKPQSPVTMFNLVYKVVETERPSFAVKQTTIPPLDKPQPQNVERAREVFQSEHEYHECESMSPCQPLSPATPSPRRRSPHRRGKRVVLNVDQSVYDAIDDIQSDETDTVWCACGYLGNNHRDGLVVYGSGNDSVEGLKQHMKEDNIVFGYTSVVEVVDDFPRTKYVYILWIGEKSKPMAKAYTTTQKKALGEIYKPHHAAIFATSLSEIDESIIMDKVSNISGSKSHVL